MEKTKHPCGVSSCRNLTTETYCEIHANRAKPKMRTKQSQHAALYKDRRYQIARENYLIAHPVCATWGCTQPATELDHIRPHRGDLALFWDVSNWQGLCHTCHSRKTATEDGALGNPIKRDPGVGQIV